MPQLNCVTFGAKVSGQQLQRGRVQSGGGEVSGCGPDGIRSGDACGGGDDDDDDDDE